MIAYFDCFSGISGDMIVGAMLDAGVPFDWLKSELKKLPVGGYRVKVADVKRQGIGGKRFRVEVFDKNQRARTLRDIKTVIKKSGFGREVEDLSIRVFERLARAEAKVHRTVTEQVHFHEVGGTDSIIDIVAASLSISYLGIREVYASEIPFFRGTVSSEHGVLPLPAPAVTELLTDVPVYYTNADAELVTPTGAAFLVTISRGFGVMPPFSLRRTGYGAGERDGGSLPNLLRVFIGEEKRGRDNRDLETDSVTIIEANIDDMSPEIYGYVMERLFEEGALDVSMMPIYMKKGRPGTVLQVICEAGKEERSIAILLRETSSIGVRYYQASRIKLKREISEVISRYGKVRVKVSKGPFGEKIQPEYEDCRKASKKHKVPIVDIYRETIKEYEGAGNG